MESVEGVGSTFTVYLPSIASEAEAALVPPAVTRAVGGHETVVFVDDDYQSAQAAAPQTRFGRFKSFIISLFSF